MVTCKNAAEVIRQSLAFWSLLHLTDCALLVGCLTLVYTHDPDYSTIANICGLNSK